MAADITTSESGFLDVSMFMREYLSDFKPFAYFDKHLDCIRVQIMDCSVSERRLSSMFTILEANHIDTRPTVGFTIKGIRHIFEKLQLPLSGVMKLTDLISAIVVNYPHTAVKAVEEFAVVSARDMEIDFSEQDAEAA